MGRRRKNIYIKAKNMWLLHWSQIIFQSLFVGSEGSGKQAEHQSYAPVGIKEKI